MQKGSFTPDPNALFRVLKMDLGTEPDVENDVPDRHLQATFAMSGTDAGRWSLLSSAEAKHSKHENGARSR
jgi:hypothetical protein